MTVTTSNSRTAIKAGGVALLLYLGSLALLLASGEMLAGEVDGVRIVFCKHRYVDRMSRVIYYPIVVALPNVRFAEGDESADFGM